MESLIRQITKQQLSRLPENSPYYRIEDLERCGLPSFLIRRISFEIKNNIDDTLSLPETDWVDTKSEVVRQAWQQFTDAIYNELRLPAEQAHSIIETAVSDVVEMLVQPRENIPELIFNGNNVLTAEKLAKRTKLLVVYPHFADILKAYMQRKGLNEITRHRCRDVITQIDEKVTHRYNPQEWAHVLDPLFELRDDTIDPDIFRLFFEDKDKPLFADAFGEMDDPISRREFLQVLASPGLLDFDITEDEILEAVIAEEKISTELKHQTEAEHEDTEEAKKPFDRKTAFDQSESDKATDKKEAIEPDDSLAKDSENEAEHPDQPDDANVNHQAEEDTSAPEFAESDTSRDQARSLNEIYISEDDESADQPEEENKPDRTDTLPNSEEDESLDKSEESPIWQRYLSSDEKNKQSEKTVFDDEHVEELFIGTGEKDKATKKDELKQLLQDEKNFYVDELFDGSEQAYEDSLRKIAQEKEWKWASKLVEKNIFRRYGVDIYSEPALNFTDQVHSYFLELQNQNKKST